MTEATRKGYDDRVARHRAKPQGGVDLDDDPAPMVQEQIARMRYFFSRYDAAGKAVLDLGCGTGFNCEYVCQKYAAADALGVDISAPTIEFARRAYPRRRFEVADVCDRDRDYGRGRWDCVICCEVFEHVPDPDALLAVIRDHLADDGTAFISTPNRLVFSLGHEPSPVNQTHIKEFVEDEFRAMLSRHFAHVEIAGQRMPDPTLFGRRQAAVRRNVRDFRLLGNLYWNQSLRRAWKVLRLEPLWRRLDGPLRFTHRDFDFTTPADDDAIWLCAVVRKH